MSTVKRKPVKAPQEAQDLFREGEACIDCRDKCVDSFFKAKRAIYYAKRARLVREQAWDIIYKLYPQVNSGVWSYNTITKMISPVSPK